MFRTLAAVALMLAGACYSPTGDASGDPGNTELKPGLQYSGAVATAGKKQISAPILPDMMIWQHKGGSGYPASAAIAQALVRDTTMTYEYLLLACAAAYPSITLSSDPATLTQEQLRTNYDQVSRCAYEKHGSKPYWMPQILDDVDVCALKLGAGWRLVSEDDLDGLSEADFQLFKDTMTIEAGDDWFPRQFYFSLDFYVRGRDGSLRWGDMTPGVQHVRSLPIDASQMKDLYTGNGRPIGVRCIATR
ncbi:MAG: hypothetical protein QM765_29160 [Myxococcales bacterium]